MATYRYSALAANGARSRGVLEAPSEDALESALSQKGLTLIDCAEQRSAFARSSRGPRGRVSREALTEFASELATAQGAGLPLLTTLSDIAKTQADPVLRARVEELAARVSSGATLAEAMGAMPGTFPPLFCGLVEAGERTGRLEGVLGDLVKHLEWQEEMSQLVSQATIYPATVLAAVFGLVVLLLAFVLPRFLVIFSTARMQLPLPTRALIASNQLFQRFWPLLLMAGVAAAFGLRQLQRSLDGRRRIDRAVAKVPVLGGVLRDLAVSRFCHNLGLMLAAGLDIQSSLSLCERLVGNVPIQDAVSLARDRIGRGEGMADALRDAAFPGLALRMVAAGERSGRLEEMLDRASRHLDREVPKKLRRFFALMEPAILAFLGGLVLFVALAIFLPLYGMLQGVR